MIINGRAKIKSGSCQGLEGKIVAYNDLNKEVILRIDQDTTMVTHANNVEEIPITKGRLFVIEGVDGSGKQTQSQRLYDRLKGEGFKVMKVSYPNYNNPSSGLVKAYLNGEFGENASIISPYVASSFYAVDRFVSYELEWKKFYEEGGIIIADRYTTANMVHQAGKIEGKVKRLDFLNWLTDLEYGVYDLPEPDHVFFLDIPIEKSLELMANRDNKFTNDSKKDIHESNVDYLRQSYNNALEVVNVYEWDKITCLDKDNELKPIDIIHQEIYSKVKRII